MKYGGAEETKGKMCSSEDYIKGEGYSNWIHPTHKGILKTTIGGRVEGNNKSQFWPRRQNNGQVIMAL